MFRLVPLLLGLTALLLVIRRVRHKRILWLCASVVLLFLCACEAFPTIRFALASVFPSNADCGDLWLPRGYYAEGIPAYSLIRGCRGAKWLHPDWYPALLCVLSLGLCLFALLRGRGRDGRTQ
jgi:hypothetical protein